MYSMFANMFHVIWKVFKLKQVLFGVGLALTAYGNITCPDISILYTEHLNLMNLLLQEYIIIII